MSFENPAHSSPRYQVPIGVFDDYLDSLVTIPQADETRDPTEGSVTLTGVQMADATNDPPQVVNTSESEPFVWEPTTQGHMTVEEYSRAFINSPYYPVYVSRGDYVVKWVYWKGLKWELQGAVRPEYFNDTMAMVKFARMTEMMQALKIHKVRAYRGRGRPPNGRGAGGRGSRGGGARGGGSRGRGSRGGRRGRVRTDPEPSQGGGNDESGSGSQPMVAYF